MKLKVIHLAESLRVSGVTRVMRNLAVLFDGQRFRSVVTGLEGEARVVEGLRAQGIECVVLGRDLAELVNVVDDNEPFVVIVHRSGEHSELWDGVICRLRGRGASAVLERNVFGYPDVGPASAGIDLVCCNSLSTLRRLWLRLGEPPLESFMQRHCMIYNPVLIACDTRERESICRSFRREHGIAEDAFVIVSLSRPDGRRMDYMMAAVMPRLARAVPNAVLVARQLPAQMDADLARRCPGHIRNLPVTEDEREVARTVMSGDVLVHFSTMGESFGMAIAEAMRSGLPVIANDTPGDRQGNAQRELIHHDVNGYLTADTFTTVSRLTMLAGDERLRRDLGAAGRGIFAYAPFAPDHIARQWQYEVSQAARRAGVDVPHGGDLPSGVSTECFIEYLDACDTRPDGLRLRPSWRDAGWRVASEARRWLWRARRRIAA